MMYSLSVHHEGLGKFQIVRGRSEQEAHFKASLKMAAWTAQYQRSIERNRRLQSAETRRAEREAFKQEAEARTAEAEQTIAELNQILPRIVETSPVFDIAHPGIVASFGEAEPSPPKYQD